MDATQEKDPNLKQTYLRDYNPLRYGIPAQFQFNLRGNVNDQVLITPHLHLHYYREFSLFLQPFSLAVTHGIAIAFFSSAY